MTLSPRAKLLLIALLFALPIIASTITYHFFRPAATGNYGELLLPPARAPAEAFGKPGGGRFAFGDVAGKWVLVAADSGVCGEACREKLVTLRQVRLALGRNAERVERVFVVDDTRAPEPAGLAGFEGMHVALTPVGLRFPPGAANDRAHVYLVDPHGNVMMRWPAGADRKRMTKDLERLLKASQIG